MRCGGHCFAGRSSTRGVLVDVSPIDSVSVADSVATIGAGARLGDVYDALEPHGVTIAAGCGPTVGIAGLALGGGLGILGRRHGLTSDQLARRAGRARRRPRRRLRRAARRRPVLGAARRRRLPVRRADRAQLRTVPAPDTTTLHLTWPHRDAAAVIEAWQAWAPDAPDELAASLLVTAGADPAAPPVVHVFGAMLGADADARRCSTRSSPAPARTRRRPTLRELPYREAKRHLAEHGPGEEAAPARTASPSRSSSGGRCPRDAVAALVEHLARRPRARASARARLHAVGRRVQPRPRGRHGVRAPRRALPAQARRHRRPGAPPPNAERARAWLARSWALAHPWGSGRVYPNFPDPELDDWRARLPRPATSTA